MHDSIRKTTNPSPKTIMKITYYQNEMLEWMVEGERWSNECTGWGRNIEEDGERESEQKNIYRFKAFYKRFLMKY